MKIKNIENLRKELARNLNEVCLGGCDITMASRSYYDVEDKERCETRSLDNPIIIEKRHRDMETYKVITDDVLYLTLDDDGITFHTGNTKKQCFKWETVRFYDDYSNKAVMMMDVALLITRLLNK